jgi:YidC/Oxa1 family membrane protein insertase
MLIIGNIFQPLIDVFESILKFFHNSIHVPWGWAIVLLTILIRTLLLPLTIKQFHSMQRMQQHMPELKAIQNRYKDDKQRQQQEMMKFYKENKINPLGSCLPLALQLPVFISLYYMLRQSLRIDICPENQPGWNPHTHMVVSTAHTVPCGPHNGASFLFISDLTNHATGIVLVVLIVLYIGTQLISSLMMSTATMDKTQRNLMLFMPLIFVIFLLNFPAGVIVYWITTNTWTIGQQYIMRKRLGPVSVPAAAAAGGAVAVQDTGGRSRGSTPTPKAAAKADAGAKPAKADAGATAETAGTAKNGSAVSAAIGGLLRGKPKSEQETTAVAATPRTRAGPPPPPPRKRKKRSGRRR